MPGKDLNVRNFFTDLIFHPEHAKPKQQKKSRVLSIAIGILSLGIVPLVVSIGWGASALISLCKGSPTSKKTATVAKSQPPDNPQGPFFKVSIAS